MKRKKFLRNVLIAAAAILLLAETAFLGVKGYGRKQLTGNAESIVGNTQGTIFYQGTNYEIRDDVINILCMGVDREEDMMWDYGDGRSVGQADAIFLASMDLKKDSIRIIAVPRDTMVTLQLYDKLGMNVGAIEGQITLQYAYSDGGDMSCYLMERRVSELLCNIPIHGVIAVNLSCIPVINDAVGGVTVVMEEDYTQINPAFQKDAAVHLWGEDAVDFIQKRDTSVEGSALTRISREKQYLNAFIEQGKQAVRKDIRLPLTLMEELKNSMITSLSSTEVLYLALEAMACDFSEEDMYVLPGAIAMGDKYEEYYIDKDAVTKIVVDLFCEEKGESNEH